MKFNELSWHDGQFLSYKELCSEADNYWSIIIEVDLYEEQINTSERDSYLIVFKNIKRVAKIVHNRGDWSFTLSAGNISYGEFKDGIYFISMFYGVIEIEAEICNITKIKLGADNAS